MLRKLISTIAAYLESINDTAENNAQCDIQLEGLDKSFQDVVKKILKPLYPSSKKNPSFLKAMIMQRFIYGAFLDIKNESEH